MARGIGKNCLIEIQSHLDDAKKRHSWPNEINPGNAVAEAIFLKLQEERAHDDWTAFSLIEIARISKLVAAADAQQAILDVEGMMLTGGKHDTTQISNPRIRIISELGSSINSTMRRLGLIGTQPPSPGETNVKEKAAAQRKAGEVLDRTSNVKSLI